MFSRRFLEISRDIFRDIWDIRGGGKFYIFVKLFEILKVEL
jgi:hypothetical protein